MEDYQKALEKDEWGSLYNRQMCGQVVSSIEKEEVFCWTEELLSISREGDNMCEVGCGSGQSAAYLAKHNRKVTAVDFSEECVELAELVNQRLHLDMRVVCADATKPLPFQEKEFDYIYQCGLLEHFHGEERIALLKNWSRYTKNMISMIPNAGSLAYRTGKALMEMSGTWTFGLELPQYSLANEFERAGMKNIREYTIGAEHALVFLPPEHYLRKALEQWIMEREAMGLKDLCGQGYLLVTVGECG